MQTPFRMKADASDSVSETVKRGSPKHGDLGKQMLAV